MTFANFRNFEFSNKAVRKENKEDKSKSNYITREDYEEVMKNIEVNNNDLEVEEALKNLDSRGLKIKH